MTVIVGRVEVPGQLSASSFPPEKGHHSEKSELKNKKKPRALTKVRVCRSLAHENQSKAQKHRTIISQSDL